MFFFTTYSVSSCRTQSSARAAELFDVNGIYECPSSAIQLDSFIVMFPNHRNSFVNEANPYPFDRRDSYHNGAPFPFLSQQCLVKMEELIIEINHHLSYLAFQIEQRIWTNERSRENYAQHLLKIISGTRIYELVYDITAPLANLQKQTMKCILEYIYQRCTHPCFAFQPIQYLRAGFFLENLLGRCYDHMGYMNSFGFDHSTLQHHQSNQQTTFAHHPAPNEIFTLRNWAPYRTVQHAPERSGVAPCQPANSISHLQRMVTNSLHSYEAQPSILDQNSVNRHTTICNTQLGSMQRTQMTQTVNSQQNAILSPPMTPRDEHRDQSGPNHDVPEFPHVDQMLNWHTPTPVAATVSSIGENLSSPQPLIDTPPLDLSYSRSAQSSIPQKNAFNCDSVKSNTQIESKPLQLMINFETQSQTLSSHRDTLVSPPMTPHVEAYHAHSQSVPIQETALSYDSLKFECDEPAAVTSIAENPSLPQPVIDLSHLNIPLAKKIHYDDILDIPNAIDMPSLDPSGDLPTETQPPKNKPNCVNTAVGTPTNEWKRFPADHFLLKKLRANRMRWPFKSLDQLENISSPKSLKNRKREAFAKPQSVMQRTHYANSQNKSGILSI